MSAIKFKAFLILKMIVKYFYIIGAFLHVLALMFGQNVPLSHLQVVPASVSATSSRRCRQEFTFSFKYFLSADFLHANVHVCA